MSAKAVRCGVKSESASPDERAAQVAGEGWSLADRVHAGFRPRVVDHGRDVPGSEYVRVRSRLQAVVHGYEATVIGGEAGVRDPARRRSGRDPDRSIDLDPRARGAVESMRLDAQDFVAEKHLDLPRRQHVAEDALAPCGCGS